jgi:hypothetical protein
VFFFVHVWPESGWQGAHDPLQLKSDIESWFKAQGLKKLNYHVIVDSAEQLGTCEADKAWERCTLAPGACDKCFNFCQPWIDYQWVRPELLWDRVMFVESNRRSRFAYVMRMRTHTQITSMPSYTQLREDLGV